jgi:hypothetical protein
MAEIELNVLIRQCLNRRIPEFEVMRSEVKVWEAARNGMNAGVNWQFTAEDARIKLNRLYIFLVISTTLCHLDHSLSSRPLFVISTEGRDLSIHHSQVRDLSLRSR